MAFSKKEIDQAVKIAKKMGGNYSGAVRKIESMKKGLSKEKTVADTLYKVNNESVTYMKAIVKEAWGKNLDELCASMKLNKIQKDILKDYMDHGQVNAQYVGRAAGDVKASRIYAAKKPYKGQLSDKKEALYNAMKLNTKQKTILQKYISSGTVMGKYTGSMAGSTKETKRYAGMKRFAEHFEIKEARLFKATLDFDMGDPRDHEVDWEDDGVYIDSWDKREMELVVVSKDKRGLQKWLVDVYGLDKKEAQRVVK